MQPKRICVAAVSFLVIISIFFAVIPISYADQVTELQSPMTEPIWKPMYSDEVDRHMFWQHFYMVSNNSNAYLVKVLSKTNYNEPIKSMSVTVQSEKLRVSFTFNRPVASYDCYLEIYDILSGDLLWHLHESNTYDTDYRSSIAKSTDVSVSGLLYYYTGLNSSVSLILLNNVDWTSRPRQDLISDNNVAWLHYPPSYEWFDYSNFYAYNSDTYSATEWVPGNRLLTEYMGRSWIAFQTDRFVPDLFTFSQSTLLFDFFGDDKSYVYGQSFNVQADFMSLYPIDTYLFIGSSRIGNSLSAILNGDLLEEFTPTAAIGALDALQGSASGDDWFFSQKLSASSYEEVLHFNLNFTIPSDWSGDTFSICFVSSVSPPRSTINDEQSWAISDIYINPVGSSRDIVLQRDIEVQFRNDVIGSDVEGHESGIKGIFNYIKEIPGEMREQFHDLGVSIETGFVDLGNFVMGSDEEGNEQGIKGLLKKVRELPETLGEKIKSLFVPDENFFDYDPVNEDDPIPMGYKQRFTLLFEQHLGAVYQAPAMVIDFIQELNDFEPVTGLLPQQYDIAFPAKSFFIQVDPPLSHNHFDISEDPFSEDDSEFILLPDSGDGFYHVDLSFLASDPYSTLYSIYRAVSSFILIVSIITFCIFKFNEILRGMPSDDN